LHDGGITKLTGTLEVTGAMVLGSTLDLTGLASLDGGINVDDLFTVSSATGAITGSSTLDVTGLSSLDGGIDVNAKCTIASATGDIATDGDLSVAGDLHVSGVVSVNTFPTSIARYTTTGTVNIPAGCNGLIIEIVGGGGSGGGYGTASDSGGGGGGGGYIEIYITKNMISALSLSSIYFVCGTGGASVLGDYSGNDGVASGCYENTSGGTLIAYANPGSAGGRGNNYSGGGYGGSLIPGTAYEDMYKEIRGEFGDAGYDAGTRLAHTRGGKGGSSHLGRGGRGGYQLADATPGIVGGGGGGAYYNRGDTSGAGGSGMMQITFY